MTAFIFDVDDTLYDQRQPFQQAFDATFDLPDVPLQQVYLLSRQLSDQVFHDTETGKLPIQAMWIYRIQGALAHYQHAISDQQALAFQTAYQAAQHRITLLNDVRQTLDFCQQQHATLGVITNGPDAHQRAKIAQLGLTNWISNQQTFTSGGLHLAKPDPRIFQHVARQLHLNPHQTFYVGDSFENDVIGAKQAGWQSIWINRQQRPRLHHQAQPDFIVNAQQPLLQTVQTILQQKG
jgi:putative hydrolase of the HAD superfamily